MNWRDTQLSDYVNALCRPFVNQKQATANE
jgi:hypothetical protein